MGLAAGLGNISAETTGRKENCPFPLPASDAEPIAANGRARFHEVIERKTRSRRGIT